MFVVPLYQMLPDRASLAQANLCSEEVNGGRLGKNKICVFASQEVEERDQHMIVQSCVGLRLLSQGWAVCQPRPLHRLSCPPPAVVGVFMMYRALVTMPVPLRLRICLSRSVALHGSCL